MGSSMYRLQGMEWVGLGFLLGFICFFFPSPHVLTILLLFFFLSTENLFCNKIFLKKRPYLFKLKMWNLVVKTGGLYTELFEAILIVRTPMGV